ncbi:gas vesicle structural protein GvpA [Streptomyces sp. LX-29]|uniref:gas vesicle protein GvpJ n=1 Tax=Streptomyces sp. LX-29 TaxID=2900152 RepID=UPI00240E8C41|nr:gas vesicle protein GvpJ [Streptomyces sp. LX-29]WFB06125.1 gas vesicle structural protein GvpA [Streptomyces sp. LX-29]
MTVVPQGAGGGAIQGGATGSLYDILDLILDRGLVIDVFARVSLVGIEILKIDARVVVASVDTYLRFAEACNRLDLETGRKAPTQLTDIVGEVTESGSEGKVKGALTGAVESVADTLSGGRKRDSEEEGEEEKVRRRASRDDEEGEERRRRPTRRTSRREKEE